MRDFAVICVAPNIVMCYNKRNDGWCDMAAIVYQRDKRSGITYAYESVSHWDKEKNQSRAKRTLIGRVNPETGEITPTDGRNKKDIAARTSTQAWSYRRRKIRSVILWSDIFLDTIAEKLGVERI